MTLAQWAEVDAPGCDGLTIDLDALWREANRLEAEGGDGNQG